MSYKHFTCSCRISTRLCGDGAELESPKASPMPKAEVAVSAPTVAKSALFVVLAAFIDCLEDYDAVSLPVPLVVSASPPAVLSLSVAPPADAPSLSDAPFSVFEAASFAVSVSFLLFTELLFSTIAVPSVPPSVSASPVLLVAVPLLVTASPVTESSMPPPLAYMLPSVSSSPTNIAAGTDSST